MYDGFLTYYSNYSGFQIVLQNLMILGVRLRFIDPLTSERDGFPGLFMKYSRKIKVTYAFSHRGGTVPRIRQARGECLMILTSFALAKRKCRARELHSV